MVQSGRDYSRQRGSPARLMYQWHGKEYLGAAHGVSGIYQIFVRSENENIPYVFFHKKAKYAKKNQNLKN
jgi:hypothetical protein